MRAAMISRAAGGGVLAALVVVPPLSLVIPQAAPEPVPTPTLSLLYTPGPGPSAPPTWVNCVGTLHVAGWRGHDVANAWRYGEANPPLRTSARVADLSPADLATFCDWEACVQANGYNHTCWVDDAGWERCRMCDGSADCGERFTSQAGCIARATQAGRATCHVGLLQECALQRALRGPADTRVTQTCWLSQQACAGALPGDLSAQALSAQHETDQVTVEERDNELRAYQTLWPDSGVWDAWQAERPTVWDGGAPTNVDPFDGAPLPDTGASDAGSSLDAGDASAD